MLFAKLEEFSASMPWNLFSAPPPPPPPPCLWDSSGLGVRTLYLSHRSLRFFRFFFPPNLPFLYLILVLGVLLACLWVHCFPPLSNPIQCWVNCWGFSNMVIVFFSPSSEISLWCCFISSISLLRSSIFFFSFVSSMFIIAYWNIFIMAALKDLPDNSISIGTYWLPFHTIWDFPASWYGK